MSFEGRPSSGYDYFITRPEYIGGQRKSSSGSRYSYPRQASPYNTYTPGAINQIVDELYNINLPTATTYAEPYARIVSELNRINMEMNVLKVNSIVSARNTKTIDPDNLLNYTNLMIMAKRLEVEMNQLTSIYNNNVELLKKYKDRIYIDSNGDPYVWIQYDDNNKMINVNGTQIPMRHTVLLNDVNDDEIKRIMTNIQNGTYSNFAAGYASYELLHVFMNQGVIEPFYLIEAPPDISLNTFTSKVIDDLPITPISTSTSSSIEPKAVEVKFDEKGNPIAFPSDFTPYRKVNVSTEKLTIDPEKLSEIMMNELMGDNQKYRALRSLAFLKTFKPHFDGTEVLNPTKFLSAFINTRKKNDNPVDNELNKMIVQQANSVAGTMKSTTNIDDAVTLEEYMKSIYGVDVSNLTMFDEVVLQEDIAFMDFNTESKFSTYDNLYAIHPLPFGNVNSGHLIVKAFSIPEENYERINKLVSSTGTSPIAAFNYFADPKSREIAYVRRRIAGKEELVPTTIEGISGGIQYSVLSLGAALYKNKPFEISYEEIINNKTKKIKKEIYERREDYIFAAIDRSLRHIEYNLTGSKTGIITPLEIDPTARDEIYEATKQIRSMIASSSLDLPDVNVPGITKPVDYTPTTFVSYIRNDYARLTNKTFRIDNVEATLDVDNNGIVSVTLKNVPIYEGDRFILQNFEIKYDIDGRSITVTEHGDLGPRKRMYSSELSEFGIYVPRPGILIENNMPIFSKADFEKMRTVNSYIENLFFQLPSVANAAFSATRYMSFVEKKRLGRINVDPFTGDPYKPKPVIYIPVEVYKIDKSGRVLLGGEFFDISKSNDFSEVFQTTTQKYDTETGKEVEGEKLRYEKYVVYLPLSRSVAQSMLSDDARRFKSGIVEPMNRYVDMKREEFFRIRNATNLNNVNK